MSDNVTNLAAAEPSSNDFTDFPTEEPYKFYKRFHRLTRIFGPLIRWYASVHVIGLENLPPDGGFVVVANHQQIVDSPLITAILAKRGYTTRFLAKASYWERQPSRFIMDKTGQIPIDRKEHGKKVETSLELGVKTLSIDVGGKRWVTAGHPEGTRSKDGKLHRGRPGLAVIAIRAGVSIVPAGILYADPPQYREIAWPKWLRWLDKPLKLLRKVRRVKATVIFDKPFSPSLESNDRLAAWVDKHGLLKYYRGVERYANTLEGTKIGEGLSARLAMDYATRQVAKLSHREYIPSYLPITAR